MDGNDDRRNVATANDFAKLLTGVERLIARDEGAEVAGQWRAEQLARDEARAAERAALETPGRRARQPGDRRMHAPTSSTSPRARARGSSGAARRRAVRADAARRERLRADLVRRGAPPSTPTPLAVPWQETRRAARCWSDGRACARVLAGLPQDVARRLRGLVNGVRSRAHARRLVAAYVLLHDVGGESRRGGASWLVVAGYCRAILCAMLPASDLRSAQGEHRSIDENTWSNYCRALVGAGLLDVLQPGGPESPAAERNVHVGPSGWALSQYRLLWYRFDSPGNNPARPASRVISTGSNPVPSHPGATSATGDEVRTCGPPE